jgi:tetratricopeptide (TPR) repeat protein
VLQSLQLSRRDIKLYEDLGRRLAALGRAKEQERAYTAIVEVLPSESESHALLAEIREKENRWGEAIGQWQQVARIRALEPTGLLRLAAAQIHQKQWREAAETVGRLRVRSWPTRFGNVVEQVRQLEGQIERGRDR